MMTLTSLAQAGIMVGSNGVCHICISPQLTGQFHALPDNHHHMVALMGFVKAVIPRYDMLFHILLQFRIDNPVESAYNLTLFH